MFKTVRSLLLLAFLILPFASHAQDKVENGGDTEEIEFKIMAKQIQQWFESEKNQDRFDISLSKTVPSSPIDAKKIRRTLKIALENLSVQFTEKDLRVGLNKLPSSDLPNMARVCLNFNTVDGILCDRNAWNNAKQSSKYLLVFHEIMGASGVENNTYGFSVYDYTLALAEFVDEIKSKSLANMILKCDSSDYLLQIENQPDSGMLVALTKTNGTSVSKKINFKILDISHSENGKARAYIEIARSGLFPKKTILQCN